MCIYQRKHVINQLRAPIESILVYNHAIIRYNNGFAMKT